MLHHCLFVLACLSLSACTDTVISNGTIGGAWGRHQTPVTYTTADVRMISERPDPVNPTHNLVCTEPLPDVAKALSSAAEAHAQGSGGGAVNVTLGGGYSSAEALLELAGRSTALLGLRDGLYRACEAYANGAIGDDAYSLILSRYGTVMVTLFLAQDMQNAARGTNTVQSPTITFSDGDTHITPAPSAAGGGAAVPDGRPGGARALVPAGGLPTLLHRAGYEGSPLAGGLAPWTGEGAPLAAPRTPARIVPAGTINLPNVALDSGQDQTTGSSAAAAQAIGKLAEDFFASGKDSLHTLMIACINDNDTTRLRLGSRNDFLHHACPMFYDPGQLKKLADILDRPAVPFVNTPPAAHNAR